MVVMSLESWIVIMMMTGVCVCMTLKRYNKKSYLQPFALR
jgi:hypothetical protein